jgi:hypothetical protein
MALELGAPSVVEVLETSGMTREMYPEWSVIRFDWAARGKRPPLSVFWYDGGKTIPPELSGVVEKPGDGSAPLKGGGGGMVWIGTKGSYPAGRGKWADKRAGEIPRPPQREWGREEVHKDWAMAVKAGKQAPCNFAYAGPFTEAYLLGNIALRVGHRVEWDPKAFRITNCREANQYVTREYRKGWDLQAIAGSAWNVANRKA